MSASPSTTAPVVDDSVPAADLSTTIPGRILASGSTIGSVLAPVGFGVLFLGLWQVLVVVFDVPPYIIPSPTAILGQFVANFDTVLAGTIRTGVNALIGLLIGTVIGVLAAIVASVFKSADSIAAPAVSALSVMPIVALAPILYTMFGAGEETARQIVAALAVLIPIYLNTLKGLRQVRPVHRDLMRIYAATPLQQQMSVTLPTAAPYLFTGLRIASSLAVISALVAEYFGGPVGGLGKSITSAASSSNYALAWAYVVGAILLGLAFYSVALAIETYLTRHRRSS